MRSMPSFAGGDLSPSKQKRWRSPIGGPIRPSQSSQPILRLAGAR